MYNSCAFHTDVNISFVKWFNRLQRLAQDDLSSNTGARDSFVGGGASDKELASSSDVK